MICEDLCILADKAYKGIHKIHLMSLIPVKATKSNALNNINHAFNFLLPEQGFLTDILKFLHSFSSRYRNKCKRFTLRFSLNRAIYNFQYNQ